MNPKDHPNAFVSLSSGSVASFIVYEANKRGLNIDVQEAGMIVGAVVTIFLFAGRKLGAVKP